MTDPNLERLWKRVLDDWDNEACHGAFLEHCQTTDQLLEAAVRYRGMAGDRDRGEIAQKRLGGVTLLAMAKLESTRTTPRQASGNAARLLVALLFLAGSVALALYAAR
jgi:hypothetical protein